MFYDILDKKRIEILSFFNLFKDRFYLAGGTGLALQIGHRDSIDFDFFKLSFFRYPYILIKDCLDEENLRIASIEDIACMKLSAIVSRAVEKDFVDLYFIIKKIQFKHGFNVAMKELKLFFEEQVKRSI